MVSKLLECWFLVENSFSFCLFFVSFAFCDFFLSVLEKQRGVSFGFPCLSCLFLLESSNCVFVYLMIGMVGKKHFVQTGAGVVSWNLGVSLWEIMNRSLHAADVDTGFSILVYLKGNQCQCLVIVGALDSSDIPLVVPFCTSFDLKNLFNK